MKSNEKMIQRVFYILVLTSLVIFAVSIPLTHYNSLKLYLWKPGNSFYDFFESLKINIYWKRNECYEAGSIYPPLANLFYLLITRCMSIGTLQQLDSLSDYSKIKALQECSIYFVLYMNTLLVFYYLVCTGWKKGSRLEKNIFAAAMLFSVPFLYQFERANIIFLALLFTMLFFLWKDSESRLLRELSYVSLAVAAGLKIYPAVFGLLILKEKRYKDTVRLVFYGILAFMLPFLFYGGFHNVTLFLENMLETSSKFSMTRIGYQLDYYTVLKNVSAFAGSDSVFIGKVFQAAFALLGLWAAFGLRERWKTVLLLTCMVIGVPSISYVYTAIFMIIPIIVYLDSGSKKKRDLIYLAGMLLVVLPLPFCWKEGSGNAYYSYMNVSVPVWVEGLSVAVMTALLILDGLMPFFRKVKAALCSTAVLLLVIFLSLWVNRASYHAPFAYTDYLSGTLSNRVDAVDGDIVEQSFTANDEFLNYIVLRLKPADSGSMTVSVKQAGTGSSVFEQKYGMSELEKGYNQLEMEHCSLVPGESYELELAVESGQDEKMQFWTTVPEFDTGEETFRLNEETLDGALGVQFYESGTASDRSR